MRFRTLKQLIGVCSAEGKPISQIMLEDQTFESGRSAEQEREKMAAYYQVMKDAVRKGLTESTLSRSGLTGLDARRVMDYRNRTGSGSGSSGGMGGTEATGNPGNSGNSVSVGSSGSTGGSPAFSSSGIPGGEEALLGGPASLALAYALAVSEVNASMGRIVATPTAGSCGIIPGVFVSAQERFKWSDGQMTAGLFCSGAIGYVIANNSFISGAEGGCQAEVGSAIGMAAGALVELRGGTPEQAVHAVGLALKNTLGLICDPVAGLVEIPCIVRNGFGAVTALAAADMALAGVRSVIPSDEVIQVMLAVGSSMPEKHRETAKGGLARTPTGRRIMCELYGSGNDAGGRKASRKTRLRRELPGQS